MKPLLISPFNEHPMARSIAAALNIPLQKVTLHDFPDGETTVKFEVDLANRDLILLTSLDQPNTKILPLLFIAETAKDLGAKRIGLCVPYLAYMRQDKRFHKGESITADYFSKLLSQYFDWLVTIDPHLHRHHTLSEIYSIPSEALHATKHVARWIAGHIENPLLIGPDHESKQWVEAIAHEARTPYLILEKIRHGDSNVEISSPEIGAYKNHTPVLVDDIISTAQTMIQTLSHLKKLQMAPPVCIGVHAVFAGNAYDALLEAGAARVISCNTIHHPSNSIDLSPLLLNGIQERLDSFSTPYL